MYITIKINGPDPKTKVKLEECGGSVVECLNQDGGVAGMSRTGGTFVIHFFNVSYLNLLQSKISIFQLVSEAKENGLSLTLSETPKIKIKIRKPYLTSLIM